MLDYEGKAREIAQEVAEIISLGAKRNEDPKAIRSSVAITLVRALRTISESTREECAKELEATAERMLVYADGFKRPSRFHDLAHELKAEASRIRALPIHGGG